MFPNIGPGGLLDHQAKRASGIRICVLHPDGTFYHRLDISLLCCLGPLYIKFQILEKRDPLLEACLV